MADAEPRLRQGRLGLILAPGTGGSIARFDFDGDGRAVPVLRGSDGVPASALEAACFPLVPFCNRIRGGRFTFQGREVRMAPNMAGDVSPLHGQGWLAAWTAGMVDERSVELIYHHARSEWPWDYVARQQFRLDEGGLSLTLFCRNVSDEPMPCGLGLHPYFPCSRETRLDTRTTHVWLVDENILPTGRAPADGAYDLGGGPICGRGLDNGYEGWDGMARISTPGAPFSLRLSSPDAGYFQLYSPVEGKLFVAEPVSHVNDALSRPEQEWEALGLRILAPGEEMSLNMRLDVIPAMA